MTHIVGQEISRSSAKATLGRLIDLRQPLVPALSPKHPPSSLVAQPVVRKKLPLAGLGTWPWSKLLWRSAKLGLFVGLTIVLLSLNIGLPERLIGLYAIAAFLYGIDSQRTLLIALLFVASIAVWSALGQSENAQNNAIYAFYFLVIGLVSAIGELASNHRRLPDK